MDDNFRNLKGFHANSFIESENQTIRIEVQIEIEYNRGYGIGVKVGYHKSTKYQWVCVHIANGKRCELQYRTGVVHGNIEISLNIVHIEYIELYNNDVIITGWTAGVGEGIIR